MGVHRLFLGFLGIVFKTLLNRNYILLNDISPFVSAGFVGVVNDANIIESTYGAGHINRCLVRYQ